MLILHCTSLRLQDLPTQGLPRFAEATPRRLQNRALSWSGGERRGWCEGCRHAIGSRQRRQLRVAAGRRRMRFYAAHLTCFTRHACLRDLAYLELSVYAEVREYSKSCFMASLLATRSGGAQGPFIST